MPYDEAVPGLDLDLDGLRAGVRARLANPRELRTAEDAAQAVGSGVGGCGCHENLSIQLKLPAIIKNPAGAGFKSS